MDRSALARHGAGAAREQGEEDSGGEGETRTKEHSFDGPSQGCSRKSGAG